MKNADNLLATLAAIASTAPGNGVNSYEDPASRGNYELAAFESYLVSTGMDSYSARNTAAKAVQVPAMAAAIRQSMQASNTKQGGQGLEYSSTLQAANFGLTITRGTATILQPLPAVLFGYQDSKNGYRNIINGSLPVGVSLRAFEVGEVAGKPDSATFEYSDGVNTDIVSVQSETYPYPGLLEASGSDRMRMSKIRMELSDSTQQSQIRQELKTVSNSPFGKTSTNSVSATAFKRPDQFQAGIVDLDAVFEFDKETSLFTKVIAVAGFSVTYNSFVEKFDRPNITKGGW
jgi:hypothetical protein